MPILTGVLFPKALFQDPPSWPRSPQMSRRTPLSMPLAAWDGARSLAGTCSDTQPVDEPQNHGAGCLSPAFSADWYHRIHILPAVLALGNLISAAERFVELWNAHFTAVTLTGIQATGTDGLVLIGLGDPTLPFHPLQSRRVTVVISTHGAPVIAASYRFVFSNAITAVLQVTGQRIAVFGLRPNWAHGITERLEWLTDVLESYDGSEQRVPLRQFPRRTVEYAMLLEGNDARWLEQLLFAWGARTYCLPIWMHPTVLAMPVPSGTTQFAIHDALAAEYQPGGLAVLWRSNRHYEAVEIERLDGHTLTLKHPLGQSWPAGSRLFPAHLASLDAEVTLTQHTDAILAGTCRFALQDSSAVEEAIAGSDDAPTYRGARVFTLPPERSSDATQSWQLTLLQLDNRTALPVFDDPSNMPNIGHMRTWLLPDRTTIAQTRAWLEWCAGRAHACWMPSFQTDMQLAHTVAASSTELLITHIGYAACIDAHPLRRDLILHTTAGTFYRRIVGAIEVTPDTEQLALDAPLGIDLTPERCLQLAYLEWVRLDQDAIELFWDTDGIAHLQLSTRVLPA